jgi:precorrin-6y C5,15-methyltransferase (decarboxylating) CbiE subunit
MAVNRKTIEIVGCGPGAAGYVTGAARSAVSEAGLLAGSPRLVELFPDYRGERLLVDAHIGPLLDQLDAAWRLGRKVAVLVSGDPGLYSLADRVLRRFGRENCRVTPAVSSVQVAFARLGLSWDNARIVSAHGRVPPDDVDLSPWDKLAVLGGTREAMRWAVSVSQQLRETHAAYLCENLTLPGERVCRLTPEDLRMLSGGEQAGAGSDVGRIANPSSKGVDLMDGLAIRPTGMPTPDPSPIQSVASLAILVLVREELL